MWIAFALGATMLAVALIQQNAIRAALTMVFVAAVIIAAATPPPPRPVPHAGKDKPRASALERVRLRAARSIDRTFGEDAPLAKALLVADQRQIPTEMRDKYAAAGLVHMLSISGLHVAVIAAAMELLLQAARLSRRASLLGAFVATALYVAVIGAPPPALRSAAMLGVAMTSRISQRPTSPWAAWAIGAFVPLVQPRTVLDVGYQLSVLGMCALVAGGSLWRRRLSRHFSGWKAAIARDLTVSIVACAVTVPLVAWVFGRISLIAPLSNLVAAPVIGLAQPILFLGLLLAPFGSAAAFCAQAVHPLLVAFDWIASFASGLPGASVTVSISPITEGLAATAAIALILACVSRFPSRPAVGAVASLALIAVLPASPFTRTEGVELHVLDVGQGDAILLRTPGNHWVLFDAGPAWSGGDAGRSVILPYIRRRGGTLTAFVLSHPHTDHVGGAASVLRGLHPHTYWDAAFAGGSDAYIASLAAAREEGVEWHRVHPADSVSLDGVAISFLAPDSAWTVALKDPNLASTVALVRYGDVRFLLVGDAEWEEERWLVARYHGELRADVLKVGYHGSSTSSSDAFLSAVKPSLALVSVGAGNKYGHPSGDVLAALARTGAIALRTDEVGTIIVRTNGARVDVETNGDRWELARGSPPP